MYCIVLKLIFNQCHSCNTTISLPVHVHVKVSPIASAGVYLWLSSTDKFMTAIKTLHWIEDMRHACDLSGNVSRCSVFSPRDFRVLGQSLTVLGQSLTCNMEILVSPLQSLVSPLDVTWRFTEKKLLNLRPDRNLTSFLFIRNLQITSFSFNCIGKIVSNKSLTLFSPFCFVKSPR